MASNFYKGVKFNHNPKRLPSSGEYQKFFSFPACDYTQMPNGSGT